MPKSDTWPSGGALETGSSMDSAGSCDSVAGTISTLSDTNLGHLSAEERECLMFLEETIESLEAQDDSGPSADTRGGLLTAAHLATKTTDLSCSSLSPDAEVKGEMNDEHPAYLTPPPLFLDENVESEDLDTGFLPPGPSPLSNPSMDIADIPNTLSTPAECKPSQSHKGNPSNTNLEFIPPPSDFQDDPAEPAEHPVNRNPNSNPGHLTFTELQELRRRASLKKSLPVVPESKARLPAIDQNHSTITTSSSSESKTSPPAVAPKPKKLPSNIILKSHKAPAGSADPSPSSLTTSPSERTMIDPQKVRMEALRKLGLLKDDEPDFGIHSPGHSPKSLRSSQPFSPPVSPTPTHVQCSDNAAASTSPTLRTISKEAHELKNRQNSANVHQRSPKSDLSTGDTQQVTKIIGLKSASLDRNTGGLNGYIASLAGCEPLHEPSCGNGSLAPLRNPRPRPASLGNKNDFSSIQGEATTRNTSVKPLEAVDDEKVTPPTLLQKTNSHKLPRSPGISVVISPRGDVGEQRREALKKLGLLKD